MHRISKLYMSLANLVSRQSSMVVDMPYCRSQSIFNTLSSFFNLDRATYLHKYIDTCHKKYGPLFRTKIGPTKAIFVSSTETIREIFRLEGPTPQHFIPEAWLYYNQMRNRQRGLLFMDGQEWLYYRRILNKIMLSPEAMNLITKPCYNAANDLVRNWKTCMDNDQVIPNLENQMYQWSIEVLLATLVGTPWSDYKYNILTELQVLSRSLGRIFEHSVYLSRVSARLAMYARFPSWRGFVNSADYAFSTVNKLVEEMMHLKNAEDGLLHRMMANGIRGDVLQRIVVDLILAAGDTTAYSMQWFLFLMASNPKVQEKMYNILRGLEEAEVHRDSLLKGAIKESLRLYPTAPFLTRVLPQDTMLGGYPAYKGELVVISLYSCGRDEANFPRAQEFLPERWLRNEKGEFEGVINPNATLPFAMGVRSCIGKQLAVTQMSITMFELLKNFKIECLNISEITMKLRLISAPSEPLKLQLTPRSINCC